MQFLHHHSDGIKKNFNSVEHSNHVMKVALERLLKKISPEEKKEQGNYFGPYVLMNKSSEETIEVHRRVSLKKSKRSQSFVKWLFNNNEL